MKKIFIIFLWLLEIVILVALLYGASAFVAWEINIKNWSNGLRFMFLATAIITAGYLLYKRLRD